MTDRDGNNISKDDLVFRMVKNQSYKELKQKMKAAGQVLKVAYIIDERLVVNTEHKDGYGCGSEFYIDDFLPDGKHAKIRYIPKIIPKHWYDSFEEFDKTGYKQMKAERNLYKWLSDYDFSNLYTVHEKTTTVLIDGSFHFNDRQYPAAVIGKIVKFLQAKYETEQICGVGYAKGNDILIITKDFAYAKRHFGPAYYDAFTFYKNGEPHKARAHAIGFTGTAYSDLFVDDIVSFDGENAKLDIRSVLSRYSKCSDTFHACAELNKELILKMHPFIFKSRHAENYHPIFKDMFTTATGCTYIITSTDDIEHDEAYRISENK